MRIAQRLGYVSALVTFVLIGMNTGSAATRTWNGGISTDWDTPDNWNEVAVPLSGDDVVFPNIDYSNVAINEPTVPAGGAACQTISINTTTAAFTLTLSGTLSIDAGGSISATGGNLVTITGASGITAGGTITFDNDAATYMAISCATITGNGTNLITFSGSEDISVSAVITDSGSGNPVTVTMDDSVDAVGFSAANTYTGLLTITKGVLLLSHVDAFGTGAGGISLGGGTLLLDTTIDAANWDPTITLTSDSAIFNSAVGSEIDQTINLNANTLHIRGGENITYSGIISGTGGLTVNMTAADDVVSLSAPNSYSGATTLTQGLLDLNGASPLGFTSSLALNGGSMHITTAGGWTPAYTLGAPFTIDNDGAGSVIDGNIDNGGNLLTVTGSENLEFQGIISGAGGLTVNMDAADDVVTLSGANTYSGLITVTQGVLDLAHIDAFGTGAGGISLGGGTLRNSVSITEVNWDPTITLTSDSTIDCLAACYIDQAINNGGNLLTITGNQNFQSTGVISGTGGITVNMTANDDLVGLYAANTYSGLVTLIQGALALANVDAFGTGAGGISLGGGILILATSIDAANWDPAITLTGDAVIDAQAANCEIDQTINLNANTLTMRGGENVELSGVISGTGGVSVNMTAPGDRVDITGANTFSGALTLTQGHIMLTNATAFGTGAGGISLGGGQLEINVALNAAAWTPAVTLTGDASIAIWPTTEIDTNINLNNNTLTLSRGDTVVSGIISGTGGLTIEMETLSNVVTLSAVNTYTGATTINRGIVAFNSIPTGVSAVTANNAGTRVEGTGTIPGTLTMNDGTILAPGGTSVGTLTVAGAITLNGESYYEVTATGANPDQIVAGAAFTATGNTPDVRIQGGYDTSGFTLPETILNVTGAYTALDEQNLPAGWDIDDAPVGGLIRITSTGAPAGIPTLSEWGMILFSLLLAGTAVIVMRKHRSGAHIA